jgi:hypothetical protein
MKTLPVLLLLLSLMAGNSFAAASPPNKMRPYSGIGVLLLKNAIGEQVEPFPLYEEPGLARLGSLNQENLPGAGWIFGTSHTAIPLVVTARKGAWLRVVYDDAGREAWLNPLRSGEFQTWELYLKGHMASVLPGLQKKYLQLYQKPNRNELNSLTPRQLFRVLQIEGDWAMVLYEQNLLGWLRWRDEDGRLLIGVSPQPTATRP